ncbi:V-type immunoglobulin domain-containing suppressor of T-cell activation isoform X2 [Haemorhous mexicanus]|uniref:V-type immunoglobulin domain-containing suppressor of T-cell activation isoform X2 n=1 Tax=Haemorhous mexicanus TaxID=30427 RepID=UPI0028BD1E4E|nr:V-type immunoglobulin domain-containing suppressor of T-cell activation isoform X2 [Haemorhous mexicanus]
MGTESRRTGLLLAALSLLASHGGGAAFLITTPYSLCVCPEGQNVTLSCRVSGALAERHDLLYKTWYFSSTGDQSCSDKRHIRNVTDKELHHDLGRSHLAPANVSQNPSPGRQSGHHGVEFVLDHHGAFHIVVMNVTLQDSGNYCCYAVEVRREGHGKPHTVQVAHGFVELQIQRGKGGLQNCTFHTATGKGAHELVRMDSSAQGIENPVFEAGPAGSAEPRPRPQLRYVASRLPSESGRHLLSEPSTPLSPPGPGDCFFPTLDPVPDSPNSLKA